MIFRDFSDFSIAGNNWKKKINYNEKRKKKKNFDAVGWKSYCSRLYCGAGRWLGCWACWCWALDAGQALGARGARRWACVGARARAQVGAGARRRQGRAGAGALGRAGRSWQAGGGRTGGGRAGARGERQACAGRAASGAHGACVAGTGSVRGSGRQGARLAARSGQGKAGWQHGRAACAHGLGQLGARAPGLVFSLVFFRLGIFFRVIK